MAVSTPQISAMLGMLGQNASPGVPPLQSQMTGDILMEPQIPQMAPTPDGGKITSGVSPDIAARIQKADLTGEWENVGEPNVDLFGQQYAQKVKSSRNVQKKQATTKQELDALRVAIAKIQPPAPPTGATPGESMVANGVGALLSLLGIARPQYIQQGVQGFLGARQAAMMPQYQQALMNTQAAQALGKANLENLSGDLALASDAAKSEEERALGLQKILGDLAGRTISAQSREATAMAHYATDAFLRQYATENGLDPEQVVSDYRNSPQAQALLDAAYQKRMAGDKAKAEAASYPAIAAARIKDYEARAKESLSRIAVHNADANLKNWNAKKLAKLIEYIPQEQMDKHQLVLSQISENMAQGAKARADSLRAIKENDPKLGKESAARWDKHLTAQNALLTDQIKSMEKEISDLRLFGRDTPEEQAKILQLQTKIEQLDAIRVENTDKIGRPLGYETPKGWLERMGGEHGLGKATAPRR